MVVKSNAGTSVSIIRYNAISVFDRDGGQWDRDIKYCGDDGSVRFMHIDTKNTITVTAAEMHRISLGPHAINAIQTVEELRDATYELDPKYRRVVDSWPDQRLREVLIDAEEKCEYPMEVLKKALGMGEQVTTATEIPTKAPPKPTEKQRAQGTYRSIPQRRKQEGSVSVAIGDISVTLTPKQLEFMERLSECPGWSGTPDGEYNASLYAQELEDTMNPMSVGAVLTTLREKNLLHTEKRRMGGVKCCMFKLTDLGVQVYNGLARR